jgi:pimeloyl-ACP methyl ester carboxylesterase
MLSGSRRAFAVGVSASAIAKPRLALADRAADANVVVTQDVKLRDPTDGWEVGVRLFTPPLPRRGKLGFIVFSHGANSSGTLYDAILKPLAMAGFVIAAPTHVDSETNPKRGDYSPKMVFDARMRDLSLITKDRAALALRAHVTASQFDDDAQIIAGHSYGALLALYLVGAGAVPMGSAEGTLPISLRNFGYRGAIAISPPGPVPGLIKAEQFDTVAAPILITTGQKDVLPGFVPDWTTRLSAFERAPTSPSYAAILPDVDHYFGGAIGRLTVPGPPQTQSLATTAQVSGLFARGFGKADRSAMRALNRLVSQPNQLDANLDLRRRN